MKAKARPETTSLAPMSGTSSTTIESGRRIAVQNLSRAGLLRDGCEWTSTMTWPSGFSIAFEGRIEAPGLRRLKLKYQAGGEYDDEVVDIDETICLERFPQPFGGYRGYFICPSSNRRCTVPYQPPGAKRFRSRWGFRCRLQYRSQQLSPIHRYHQGARRAAKHVLNKGPCEWREEYEDWEFPPKPKWMRWKTYNRLDEKALAYEKAADDQLALSLRRLLFPGESISELMDRILK
jgi:hypothetical protein